MSNARALYVVRHAPVGVTGVCYGQSDVATTLDAEAAARRVLDQLANVDVDAVHSSPWSRTRPVAERIAHALARPVVIDPRVSEISMGAWEGRTFAEIEARDGARYRRWMERWQEEGTPGGEALPAFLARVHGWLDERAAAPERVLVVTHAGVIRAVRARLSAMSYVQVAGERVEHLAVERCAI